MLAYGYSGVWILWGTSGWRTTWVRMHVVIGSGVRTHVDPHRIQAGRLGGDEEEDAACDATDGRSTKNSGCHEAAETRINRVKNTLSNNTSLNWRYCSGAIARIWGWGWGPAWKIMSGWEPRLPYVIP